MEFGMLPSYSKKEANRNMKALASCSNQLLLVLSDLFINSSTDNHSPLKVVHLSLVWPLLSLLSSTLLLFPLECVTYTCFSVISPALPFPSIWDCYLLDISFFYTCHWIVPIIKNLLALSSFLRMFIQGLLKSMFHLNF